MSVTQNLDNSLENKKSVMNEINRIAEESKRYKKTREDEKIVASLNLSSCESEDPFATDGGEEEKSYLPSQSETSDSDCDSNYSYRKIKAKLKAVLKNNPKRQKTDSGDAFEMKVQERMKNLENFVMEMTKAAVKLQQEISLYRNLPYVKVSSAYTADAPPTNHMGNAVKNFSNGTINVNVPIKQVAEASQFNEILKNRDVFKEVLDYVSVIYGTSKQRADWKMSRRILEALMDKYCLSEYTWTGKTDNKDVKKVPFKNLENVHNVVIAAIKKFDSTYDKKFFKSDMVKHVIKYAHERGKKEVSEETGIVTG